MAEQDKPEQCAVPVIWYAALNLLNKELNRVMQNIHQKEYGSPFEGFGYRFEACPEFFVEAYSWNETKVQPFNFKWRDTEISWYKYLGRGMRANQELSSDLASEMLVECLEAIGRYEETELRKKGWWPGR